MSEQPAEAVVSAPADPDPAAALDGLVDALREKYPRACHGGRLEQIEQLTTTLQHLVSCLPDEEAREADFEDRLLASYDAGQFGSDPHTASHDAKERLHDALRRRNGSK